MDIASVPFRSNLGFVHEEIVGWHFCQLHVWNKPNDIERHRYLEPQGYKVVRFCNHNVLKDIEGVIRAMGDGADSLELFTSFQFILAGN